MSGIKYTTLCIQITHIFQVPLEIYGRQNRHCSDLSGHTRKKILR